LQAHLAVQRLFQQAGVGGKRPGFGRAPAVLDGLPRAVFRAFLAGVAELRDAEIDRFGGRQLIAP